MIRWRPDFFLIDLFALEISYVISFFLRMGFNSNERFFAYQDLYILIVFSHIFVTFFSDGDRDIMKRGYIEEFKSSFRYCLYIIFALLGILFLFKRSAGVSRLMLIYMSVFSVFFVYIFRLLWKRYLHNMGLLIRPDRKMLIITDRERIDFVLDGLITPYSNYEIIGVILYDNSEVNIEQYRGIKIIGNKSKINSFIKDGVFDEVFISLFSSKIEEENLKNRFMNIGILVHVGVVKDIGPIWNKRFTEVGNYIALTSGINLPTARQIVIKRGFDIFSGIIGIIFTGIITIIFGPIIKKQSPGPIFFSQDRVGKNGRIFKMYKFRSMYPDAEERKKELMDQNKINGLMFKIDDDPRIFPIGNFMRKTSLDEFPQFLNVLMGDMSVVGTRPHTIDEWEKYELHHRTRMAIKPGITGLWQVSGRSDIVDFEEVVRLDTEYISTWRIASDIKILFKTVMEVLGRSGAV